MQRARSARCYAFAVVAVTAGWCAAQTAEPLTAGGAAVTLTTIDGAVVEGRLEASAEPGQLVVRTADGVEHFASEALMLARFPWSSAGAEPATAQPEAAPRDVLIWTHDGSKFPADITSAQDNRLTLDTPYGRTSLHLSDIAALLWRHSGAESAAIEEHLQADRAGDLLIVNHQDRAATFDGSLESLHAGGGVFRYHNRALEFEAGKTIGVVLARTRPVSAPAATCVVSADLHIAGALAGNTDGAVTLATSFGWTPDIPMADIRELRFRSGRVMYLSALRPRRSIQRSFFDVPWPARFDAAVSNRPMSMGGRRYARGIGVHAHSELTFEVPAGERNLAATIGIDDHTRPGGDVVFRVLADGREVFNSGPVTGSDPPRDILVELGSATAITLVVDSGRDLDLGDHADWAEARLIEP